MIVVVHYPQNKESIRVLEKRVAQIHAQAAISYIQKLPCPREQKLKLIKEIQKPLKTP